MRELYSFTISISTKPRSGRPILTIRSAIYVTCSGWRKNVEDTYENIIAVAEEMDIAVEELIKRFKTIRYKDYAELRRIHESKNA